MNLHVLLHAPEIPPNTGNIIRLCANTGARLHLIEPLGFALDDARLRRAGLDYHEYAQLQVHADLVSAVAAIAPRQLYALTTRAKRAHHAPRFQPGDALVFGSESQGLPASVLASIAADHRLRLPMRPGSRSLNLSNAVAVMVYEVWRQWAYVGAADVDSA